jgi:type IV pilus assembly protein PilY1
MRQLQPMSIKSMNTKKLSVIALTMAFAGVSPAIRAQSLSNYVQENFTGGSTTNSWYFFEGACLTAGTAAGGTSPGVLDSSNIAYLFPSCASLQASGAYYNSSVINNNSPLQPLVGGNTGLLPDTIAAGGALRFSNVPTRGSYPQGYQERGGILSNFSFPLAANGLQVTFTTETYEGADPGGDGADGMSFFLQDASQTPSLGATGGSLGYSCSNTNPQADGMQGGYVALGIDEYGNFLNGGTVQNSSGTITSWLGAPTYAGPGENPDGWDNTSTGYGWVANRIGMRGAGSTSWAYLNALRSDLYPSSLSTAQRTAAVQQTCTTGFLWDFHAASSSATSNTTQNPLHTSQSIPNPYSASIAHNSGQLIPLTYNYAPIPNAFKVLTGVNIANETATLRGNGTQTTAQMNTGSYGFPITYNLQITPAGLLTLSYQYNFGAPNTIISGWNITNGNGPLPANVRFGFSGSTGGKANIHELMCFQATPQNTSSSSVGLNQKQVAKVQTGTQVYFAYYDPATWAGSLVSKNLLVDVNNNVFISPTANWDASCVLTGTYAGATCTNTGVANVAPEAWGTATATSTTVASGGRQILTWSGTAGIPFEWGSLSSTQQTQLDTGDSSLSPVPPAAARLAYLRGDHSNELPPASTGSFFRDRASVLGDIIDSSPAWVGPPSATFPVTWQDNYGTNSTTLPSSTPPENSGQTYAAYTTQEQTRINVVYTGANDGFLHGFEAGEFNSANQYVGTGSGASFVGTLNDGKELLAYMPALVLKNINTTTVGRDYSNPQYGHKFDVDAAPGTGDVFYGGQWHTILVGGLGAGGAAIYALDVTNPANSTDTTIPDPTFSEAHAASLVIGEWNTTLSCQGNSSCGTNLGNTYGVPQIRRFHSGQWGAVFGNGFSSSTGDAGIFVMLLNATSGAPTFYYISTGTATCTSGAANGIGPVAAADLDVDHITDYVYAGDLCGNVWRFDLTSPTPASWTTPIKIFTTATGQPITTQVQVDLAAGTPFRRVLIEFGTGRQVPMTNTAAATYSQSQQAIYGIWDWNMGTWNANSNVKFASLSSGPSNLSGITNLTAQTAAIASVGGVDFRTVNSVAVPWAGTTGGTSYGWYLNLSSGLPNPSDVNALTSSTTPQIFEQVIFSPNLADNTLTINTTIPPSTSLATCSSTLPGGFTLAINPSTGGGFTNSVFGDANHNYTTINGQVVFGEALSGTGTPSLVTYGGSTYLVSQNVSGTGFIVPVNLQGSTSGSRLTWIEKR